MKNEQILLKKPLVIIFLSILLGSVLYYLGFNVYSLILVGLFFVSLYVFGGRKEILLFSFFIVMSLGTNHLYYKVQTKDISNFKVRIRESYYNEYLATYKGRKIYIKGSKLKLDKGREYVINGYFKTEVDKNKGIVGTLEGKYVYGEKEDVVTKLYEYREYLYNRMKSVLNEENAALVSATSFGYVDGLTSEQKDYMKYYGLIHIISVSGFHMALIYKILNKIFDYRITLLICVVYAVFTGASAATLRSLFMIIVLKLGEALYKKYDALSALCFSGIILCLLSPYNALDLGFQLSYLATLGIILFNNKLDRYFYKFPKYLREAMAISIYPQILTYPILGVTIGYFSLNVVVSNIILMPFFTLIVILGNLLLLLSVWDKLFIITLKICEFISVIIDGLINLLNHVSIPLIPLEREVMFYYIICFGSFIFVKKGIKAFRKIPLVFLIPMAISIYSPFPKIDIDKNKEIRVSYRGEISKYIVEDNKIKEKDALTGINKRYIDKIPLAKGESYIILSKGLLGIKTPSKEIYCFSINQNNSNYDIIQLNNNERFLVVKNKIIRF
ncbi:ComEC/Rec2 family competence protein [Clostridium intestinale]|uniref:Competence protein n=1 Tax=Clostridium intestinale URNW TaxID=1294142 RepID=U2N809_9CLOT|nr:ComEC/Rec2 family competence protein [Clostridium intestinale]ERK31647.1 competence protein [Clostridium intestinale URNW]